MSALLSSYDNDWTITVTNSNASSEELSNTKGSFLGNGKHGFITAFDKIGVQQSLISVDFDFNENGVYKSNVSNGFDFTTIKFFDNKPIPETNANITFKNQSLNMFNGISSTSFEIVNTSNSNVIDVSYDLYPVRHLPYCTVQTITITPKQNMDLLEFYHEVSCSDCINLIDYNNNVIYNELVNSSKGLYVLNGQGEFKDTGKKISVASCYLAEDWDHFSLIGFNRYSRDTSRCYQKLVLKNISSNVPYKLNILTTQLTEYDFKNPNEEVKRIALNIANRAQDTLQMGKLRENHVTAWFNMWKSNISIDAKLGITDQEMARFSSIRRTLRYGLYNVWSSVREGIRTEVNPAGLSVIDTYGSLFWDGDLWFIPLLTILRPDIAKTVLEARYRVIDKAIQLASGYGFSGSKYPYVNETVGYTDAPYWDLNGPMHIFNTALVSISAWNYYRITQDKDWLANKGYLMIKNNANFFASKVTLGDDGSYHMNDVYSFHDKVSNDNALTNYLVRLALKYSLEASYELNIVPVETWAQTYFSIDMKFFDDDILGIVKMDVDSTITDNFKFLEMLIPFTTLYSKNYFDTNLSRDSTNIEAILNFYKTKIDSRYLSNPLNNMLLSWINASLTNTITNDYTINTYDCLCKIIDENVVGLWGNMNMQNDATGYNDLSLSAMFLLMIITTLGTIRITGSVSETRFYNESMGIKLENTCSMPKTFKNVRLTGISGVDTYNVLNKVFYS